VSENVRGIDARILVVGVRSVPLSIIYSNILTTDVDGGNLVPAPPAATAGVLVTVLVVIGDGVVVVVVRVDVGIVILDEGIVTTGIDVVEVYGFTTLCAPVVPETAVGALDVPA
jgi:hypothetical protein